MSARRRPWHRIESDDPVVAYRALLAANRLASAVEQ
jgi:hypothetical protein